MSTDGGDVHINFDSDISSYDRYRGVVSLVSIQDGLLKKGDKIASCYTRKRYEVQEVGIMYPEEIPTDSLRPGQVGYIACNMKDSSEGLYETFSHGLD